MIASTSVDNTTIRSPSCSMSCHGSFQGRGGFLLSLFGYHFGADHKALLEADTERVDTDDVAASLTNDSLINMSVRQSGDELCDTLPSVHEP